MFLSKLGLDNQDDKYDQIISNLLVDMFKNKLDYTNTFYDLAYGNIESLKTKGLGNWLESWRKIDLCYSIVQKPNPVIIPRNHHAETAIKSAEESNLGHVYSLLEVMKNPYEFSEIKAKYMAEPTDKEKVKFTFVEPNQVLEAFVVLSTIIAIVILPWIFRGVLKLSIIA